MLQPEVSLTLLIQLPHELDLPILLKRSQRSRLMNRVEQGSHIPASILEDDLNSPGLRSATPDPAPT